MKLIDNLIGRAEHRLHVHVPEPIRHPLHVARVLAQDLVRCDLMKQASAMAYVTLLSLIPSLVAIFCVISLFSPLLNTDSDMVERVRDFIIDNLAPDSADSLVAYFDKTLDSLNLASLGWKSFAGVFISLILLLRQIEEALNRIWFIRKGRNTFTRFMYFWTFLTLGLLVFAAALGLSGSLNIDNWLSTDASVAHAHLPGWLVGISGGFIFFFFLFKIVPNCFVETRPAAIGAAVAALFLHQAASLYGLYIKSAASYKTLYGALAMAPVFLMWLYICWIIILLGALITWRLQEGFPKENHDDGLDAASTPLELLRNVQVKSLLPQLCLVWIYKHFQKGTGQGVSCQYLAHALKLPLNWVSDSLDALASMGYIVATKGQDSTHENSAATDPYFPAYPADALVLWRMHADLNRPADSWLKEWKHELPMDLAQTLDVFESNDIRNRPEATFAEALSLVSHQA